MVQGQHQLPRDPAAERGSFGEEAAPTTALLAEEEIANLEF
jgi:hypothetical protein